MKSSLRTRMTLSFVLIIALALGLFGLIGRTTINQRFNRMMVQSGREYAGRAAQFFGWYYVNKGSWEGVQDLWIDFPQFSFMPGLYGQPVYTLGEGAGQSEEVLQATPLAGLALPVYPAQSYDMQLLETDSDETAQQFKSSVRPPRDERLLLVDTSGEVIYDSNADAGSVETILANLDEGIRIRVDGEIVGTVIAASSAGILNTLQQAFVKYVNMFVLWGGIAATLVAIGLGAWQSMIILKPVRALSAASQKLARGDYSQRIPVITDDELGEMTQSFNDMASELENQESLRRRSLADVAHELRTPLSVLQIDLESIEDGIIEPDADAIQRLQMEVGTLRKLVEDLRILSLADAGELKLEFEPVDVNGLLRINARRMERQAKEKGVEIIEALAEESLEVTGDEQRLSQVFMNLLSNALQFTAESGSIRIQSERLDEHVRISFIDTGTGIPAEDLPYIFDRLYRTDSARARQNGGSGLGLSIARSLVRAHNGRIWAESVIGQGSTFAIEIPLIQQNSD